MRKGTLSSLTLVWQSFCPIKSSRRLFVGQLYTWPPKLYFKRGVIQVMIGGVWVSSCMSSSLAYLLFTQNKFKGFTRRLVVRDWSSERLKSFPPRQRILFPGFWLKTPKIDLAQNKDFWRWYPTHGFKILTGWGCWINSWRPLIILWLGNGKTISKTHF